VSQVLPTAATQTTRLAGPRAPRAYRFAAAVPAWVELALVVAAVAALLPLFAQVAGSDAGRDRRFAEPMFRIEGLPEPLLPEVCGSEDARHADGALRDRLCSGGWPLWRPTSQVRASPPLPATPGGSSIAIARAAAQAREAFIRPLRAAEARLATLRRESEGDVRGDADAIAAIEAEVQPYVERFELAESGAAAGPRPLNCALRQLDARADRRAGSSAGAATAEAVRANAVLLTAAALDGHAATEALADQVPWPVPADPASGKAEGRGDAAACGSPARALAATAALMRDARHSMTNARKNEAQRALIRSAGWQWAGAMALGYAMLVWSRRSRSPAFGVAFAMALWTVAAWAARVPFPLSAARAFEPARLEAGLGSMPAPFLMGLGAVAAVLLVVALAAARAGARAHPRPPATLGSRVGYAGFVLASGIGWLLLFELSANGHVGNRYLALYHQGHLWLGMLLFSVLVFLRRPLAREIGWLLAIAGEALRATTRRLGVAGAGAALLLVSGVAVLAFGFGLAHLRQLTSELGRIWLIVGAAWFFFLRAGPLTERLAHRGPAGLSFWRYAWPMLFVVAVLMAAMLVTRDMGPLLIAGYGAGAFLAATVAMWWHQRSGRRAAAFALAVLLFAGWIGLVTTALFELGSVDELTATRLESVTAPFASTNDQLALVAWFQRAAPAKGFGFGAVPWCGHLGGARCSGVPAQIHSDYTFTAMVGVFGAAAAWAASLACAWWLHRLIRHHARVTRGEPRLVETPRGPALDGQAFLSWIAVAWVVLTSCQLAVTVAGNLGVLPLTGVTFPFVSFGMTSLLVNLAFLALCLNVDPAVRRRDG
jgi:cell division protein FtsW (lipid II flippase)